MDFTIVAVTGSSKLFGLLYSLAGAELFPIRMFPVSADIVYKSWMRING